MEPKIMKNTLTLILVSIIGFASVSSKRAQKIAADLNDPIATAETRDLTQQKETQAGNNAFLPIVISENPAEVSGYDWPMVAANPQRTSWTPEEVRGNLSVEWYHPIEP